MHILLLEDDPVIANNVKTYLSQTQGWQIDNAFSLEEAVEKIENIPYDMYIFDVMLPDWQSYDLAKQIKKFDETKPIIFLTAKADLEDKLAWFDSWGDDYITKPFAMEELIARIKNLAKRYGIWTLKIDNLEIDTENLLIRKNGKEISLNKTEWAILDYFVKNRWKIVEKTSLIEYVRGDEFADKKTERKLDVYIANLRKKIGKDHIQTIKWVGYKAF